MRRMMKEDMYDNPKCWNRRNWEEDQERLKSLEQRVKNYLLDIDRRYKVNMSHSRAWVIQSFQLMTHSFLTFERL